MYKEGKKISVVKDSEQSIKLDPKYKLLLSFSEVKDKSEDSLFKVKKLFCSSCLYFQTNRNDSIESCTHVSGAKISVFKNGAVNCAHYIYSAEKKIKKSLENSKCTSCIYCSIDQRHCLNSSARTPSEIYDQGICAYYATSIHEPFPSLDPFLTPQEDIFKLKKAKKVVLKQGQRKVKF